MTLKIILAVLILIAAILIFAAAKPGTFRIQRSIVINAPNEKVFALIHDLHNWSRWAPQDREDTTMTRTFAGSANGVGAISEWSGSGSTGQGRISIAESVPLTRISINVDFVRPFQVRNTNEFTLETVGTSTKVTWAMHGPNLYMMKLMSVFVNMDRMMGKHFETGLNNLKAVAEE